MDLSGQLKEKINELETNSDWVVNDSIEDVSSETKKLFSKQFGGHATILILAAVAWFFFCIWVSGLLPGISIFASILSIIPGVTLTQSLSKISITG